MRHSRFLFPPFMAYMFLCCVPFRQAPEPDLPMVSARPELENSYLALPISIPISSVFDKQIVENVVPMGENPPRMNIGGFRVEYAWERSPFDIRFSGNTISLQTELRYILKADKQIIIWVQVGQCGHNPEPKRRMSINVSSGAKLVNNWKLSSSTSFRVDAIDRCTVSGLHFDVTDKIKEIVESKLASAIQPIDQRISAVDFRSKVQPLWNELLAPIAVDRERNIWLKINPSQISIAPINVTNDRIESILRVEAKPIVSSDIQPALNSTVSDLADLPLGSGFHIALPIDVQYTLLNAELEKKVVGNKFIIPIGRKEKEVKIKTAAVYGMGNKTVIQVEMEGDFKGTIYFSGSPKYDVLTGLLTVPDLDYDVNTKNWLITVADWMIHGDIANRMRNASRWDITKDVNEVREKLSTTLNSSPSSNLKLSGKVNSLRPLGIFSDSNGYTVYVTADGDASLSVR